MATLGIGTKHVKLGPVREYTDVIELNNRYIKGAHVYSQVIFWNKNNVKSYFLLDQNKSISVEKHTRLWRITWYDNGAGVYRVVESPIFKETWT